jgi:lactoylglutathione lyase
MPDDTVMPTNHPVPPDPWAALLAWRDSTSEAEEFSGLGITQVGIILFTEHYESCVTFYRDQVRLPVTHVQATLTTFAFGTGYLMVEQGGVAARTGKSRSQNPTVLRFDVLDVQGAARTLRLRGVMVEICECEWGVIGVFLDPEGNRCELKQSNWKAVAPCP